MPLNQPLIRNGRRLARAATQRAGNLRDRVLRSETLVRAGLTPYEVIHQQDIVQLLFRGVEHVSLLH